MDFRVAKLAQFMQEGGESKHVLVLCFRLVTHKKKAFCSTSSRWSWGGVNGGGMSWMENIHPGEKLAKTLLDFSWRINGEHIFFVATTKILSRFQYPKVWFEEAVKKYAIFSRAIHENTEQGKHLYTHPHKQHTTVTVIKKEGDKKLLTRWKWHF